MLLKALLLGLLAGFAFGMVVYLGNICLIDQL